MCFSEAERCCCKACVQTLSWEQCVSPEVSVPCDEWCYLSVGEEQRGRDTDSHKHTLYPRKNRACD